jgi:dual specificity phosphatase 12
MSVLRRPKSLEDAGITHIVRALNGDGSGMPEELYKSLQIDIDDLDDENIIQHFGKANRFIREGLDGGGGVLVHW